MKTIKKIIAVLLMITMTFSQVQDTKATIDDATWLTALGLLEPNKEEQLNKELNRAEGITMILKALGYSRFEADQQLQRNTFTDMKEYMWASGYAMLAYELGITTGKVDGKIFDPAGKLSKKEFIVFVLRGLGYETSKAYVYAGDISVITGLTDTKNLEDEYFTKSEAATILFKALSANMEKNNVRTGKTLAEKLIADGDLSWAKAVEAGVVERPATKEDFIVKMVVTVDEKAIPSNGFKKVPRNSTMRIRFNQPVKKETITSENIQIYEGAKMIESAKLHVSRDKMEVIVDPVINYKSKTEYSLRISNGIKNQEDEKLFPMYYFFTTDERSYVTNVDVETDANASLVGEKLTESEIIVSKEAEEIDIVFDKSIKYKSSLAGITLTNDTTKEEVPIEVKAYGATVVVNIKDTYENIDKKGSGNLKENSFYTLHVKDITMVDNKKAADYKKSFVIAQPFTVANSIYYTNVINANFATDLDEETITSDTMYVTPHGKESDKKSRIKAELVYHENSETVIFKPLEKLEVGAKYTFTITTDLKDKYGNSLKFNKVTNFIAR